MKESYSLGENGEVIIIKVDIKIDDEREYTVNTPCPVKTATLFSTITIAIFSRFLSFLHH